MYHWNSSGEVRSQVTSNDWMEEEAEFLFASSQKEKKQQQKTTILTCIEMQMNGQMF